MSSRKKRSVLAGQNEANITPLADVTTTLIVVFMITMPAMMWSGINVNSAEAGSENAVVTPSQVDLPDMLTVEISVDGLTLNGRPVDLDALEEELIVGLLEREDKTVVIVPDDEVILGTVVEVLDIAKASGAETLAMLNRIGE